MKARLILTLLVAVNTPNLVAIQEDTPFEGVVGPREAASYTPGTFEKPVAKGRHKMPTYTPEARRACVGGVVILTMVINERGRVGDVKVMKPLSHGLTEKAVKAAQRFRYEPAKLNGKALPVWLYQTFNFRPPTVCSRPFREDIGVDVLPPSSRSPVDRVNRGGGPPPR